MSRLKKRVLGPLERKFFYVVFGVLWLTGALWLYFRYGTGPQDTLGSSSQTMLLKIHGAAAMAFLVIFGVLIRHIPPGWRRKHQRPSGASLLVACGFLILTGWMLYYAGNEQLRNVMSRTHSIFGLVLPVIIFLHIWNVLKRLRTIDKKY